MAVPWLLLRLDPHVIVGAAIALVAISRGTTTFAQTPPAGTTSSSGGAPADEPPDEPRGLLPEPGFLSLGVRTADRLQGSGGDRDGFYPRIGTTMVGEGWIAAGPGFRHHLGESAVVFDASGAVSWHEYQTVQVAARADVLGGALRIAAGGLWQDQPQARFYGLGPSSRLSDRAEFDSTAADYTISIVTWPEGRWSAGIRTGMLKQDAIEAPGGWHEEDHPDIRERFSEADAPGLTQRPSFWHADAVLTADALDHRGHPTAGGLVQLAASMYRDRDFGRFSYERYEVTAIQLVPIVPNRSWLALRAAAVASTTPAGNDVPFDQEPSLGGQNALRGYADDRFRDRDAIAATVESRWAIFAHLDGAVFLDAGAVAPGFRAFSGADVKTSYGFGLRIHSRSATLLRLDWAWCAEGWRLQVRLNDSLFFTTFRPWATAMPIVP